ncbi:MAG: hypothetical protein H6739_04795 [Alphaproteobacteria bacterium]|nr:hypothetical protein [Alphaproteobacteria bacterium]
MLALQDIIDRLTQTPPPGIEAVELRRFARRHQAELERALDQALAEAGFNLFERFGYRGAPRPGERGHRAGPDPDPRAFDGHSAWGVARRALVAAWDLMEESELRWAVETPAGTNDVEFTQADLPMLLHIPRRDHRGRPWSEAERIQLALDVVALAMEADPMRWSGLDLGRYDRREGSGELPRWAAEAVLEDALRPDRRLRLVNVGKGTAADFIARHHLHLPHINPRGLMYALGARYGERLVAVATAGHPTGRWDRGAVSPQNIVELTRVASDGTVRNAASMLTGRLLDLAPRSVRGDAEEGWLFVTYQLASEDGAPYKALRGKGLRPVACVRGKAPSGARAGSRQGLPSVDKLRWEAGPLAGEARWELLDGACARGAA